MKKERLWGSEEKMAWWGSGEWIQEPDLVIFDHCGFTCEVRRQGYKEPICNETSMFGGHLCGYVTLQKNHPWFGLKINDINANVHGGITFSMETDGGFIIGFDCAHLYDLMPSKIKILRELTNELREKHPELKDYSNSEDEYRNIDYAIEECKSLAEQAQEVYLKKKQPRKKKKC